MRATITDFGTKFMLEHQLRQGGVQWLNLDAHSDVVVQGCQLAVFTALLSSGGAVWNAWAITTIVLSAVYDQDKYPTIEDAAAQHIGRMAQEGKVLLVEPPSTYEEQPEDSELHE